MKRWLIMGGSVLALVVIAGGLWGYNLSKKIAGFKAAGMPKMAVTTMHAQPQQWRERLQAVGSVRAVRGADLAPELAGAVDSIHFESGVDVKAGAVLLELRAADERAKLESLVAAAELAESVYRRNLAQFEAKAISQAQLDSDAATLKGAKAQVAQQQALLDKKIIRAPFAGRLGIREVDEGQYIAAGTKVVTLQALDPIHVDFSMPQQSLASLRVGQAVSVRADVFPDQVFEGKITAIDPAVNVDTRNVQVRATLKNPERKLLPGMFARVEIEVGRPQEYLTLPQTSITYNPYGEFVYVVTTADQLDDAQPSPAAGAEGAKQLVARQVFVKVGPRRGDQVAVLSGISAGDEVVTSGQLKLKNGSPVLINNAVQPSNDPAPTPKEQ
jgi:membrane fusion protein (multidrug efflux system)